MFDAFGVDRTDLLVGKRGTHVFDPDSPESKAATKKHKGHFHPAFVQHIGAHRFVHGEEKSDKPAPTKSDDDEQKGKFPAKKGHKTKKPLPAAFSDQFTKMAKAYVPGTITLHQEAASMHSRKKNSASRRVGAGLSAGGIGASAGMAVAHNAPHIAERLVTTAPGTRARANDLLSATHAIRRAGIRGGIAAAGAGLGVAGVSAGQHVYHARRQNTEVKAAQKARIQRTPSLAKSYAAPPMPPGFDAFGDGERRIDGIPESQHSSFAEILEPVTKNYYYGSAPTPKQHPGATGTAASFGGAVSGALAAPKLGQLKRSVGPKAKALKIALKAK